ncbi:MAG: hypothetical protein AB1758_17585 [Candidatus Eremiobacterota bacterium]
MKKKPRLKKPSRRLPLIPPHVQAAVRALPPSSSPTWFGDRRPIGIQAAGQRLDAFLWVEAGNLMLLQAQVLPQSSPSTTLMDVLMNAMLSPASGTPSRPQRVVVSHGGSRHLMSQFLPGLGITVEGRPLPEMDDSFASLQAILGRPAVGYLVRGDVPLERVRALWESARRYYDRRLWEEVADNQMLELSELTQEPLFVSVLPDGLAIFLTPEAARAALAEDQARLTQLPFLSLSLTTSAEVGPSLEEEARAHGFPLPRPGHYPFLLRGDRPLDAMPRADELELTLQVLDRVMAFFGSDERQAPGVRWPALPD